MISCSRCSRKTTTDERGLMSNEKGSAVEKWFRISSRTQWKMIFTRSRSLLMRLLINGKTTLFSLTHSWKHNICQRADLARKAVGEVDNYEPSYAKKMSEFCLCALLTSATRVRRSPGSSSSSSRPPRSLRPHRAHPAGPRHPSLPPQPATWHLHRWGECELMKV